LTQQGVEIEKVSGTAMDALERAKAAGKLAEGKLLYEVVLNSDKVQFPFEKDQLTDSSKEALDQFAQQLKTDNKNVYIEIQGHTDNSGDENYNVKLGEQRAEAVRRYLNMQHGIPLHRMSVISYGESAPLVANDSREHRAENRRVSLVVLM
jgi:peptidoglycan-associated lipoprotein